jgi:hypothetical protein
MTASVAEAQVQDLGHRLPGSVGLDAGTQPEQGIYAGYRVVWFASDAVHDRRGNTVPIESLDLDAFGHAFGISGTLEFHGLYLNAAISFPIASLRASADVPEVNIDRFGLGNVFVEPLQLGYRFEHADLVAGYSFNAPTDQAERSGVGRPEWSQQASAGSTVFFDDHRGARISALATYVHNSQKRGIRITRGDSVMFQGGIGTRTLDVIDLGLTGYAIWQVTDDTGPDLPPVFAGARERAFGVGPEVGGAIPALRSQLVARFEWDIDGKARPVGTILFVGLSVVAWQ